MLAAAVVAACGRGELPRELPPVTGDAAPVAPDAGGADAPGTDAAETVRIPDDSHQLVTAVVADWDSPTAELRRWQREQAGAPWRPAGRPWTAVIGQGAAWGQGLHGDGAPGRPGPRKREGDRRSPAGLFTIGPAFGYAAAPPTGTRVAYTAVDASWQCVDDPASAHYNRVLDQRTVTPDWSSAEAMRRRDALYTWVVAIRHNQAATPGGGSCIFLHVWRDAGHPTVGCTAMAEADLVRLLAALDPAAHPVLALLPAAEYAALAPAWGLPIIR